jgi:O-antigen ligase
MNGHAWSDGSIAARLELWVLAALLFVLPTFEAPKNILTALFLLIWCGRRLRGLSPSALRPDAVTGVVLAGVAVAAASTWINWPYPNGAQGLVDTVRLACCFLAVYLGGYGAAQHVFLARAIVSGMVFSIGYAVWELSTGRTPLLELHSVGVLTQSAMYVAVVLILVLGMLLVKLMGPPAHRRVGGSATFWVVSAAVCAVAFLVMASRGAMLGLMVAGLVSALVLKNRMVWLMLGVTLAAALAGVVLLVSLDSSSPIIASVKARVSISRFEQSNRERLGYMQVAVAQFSQGDAKLLGIGPRNYQSIDLSKLTFAWPLQLNAEERRRLGHAHNAFLTKLAEEGLLGLAALVALFALVARALFRQWRCDRHMDWRWFAALGALTVPAVTGQFNTPFYQEHALLDMFLMAIFMASVRDQTGPGGG